MQAEAGATGNGRAASAVAQSAVESAVETLVDEPRGREDALAEEARGRISFMIQYDQFMRLLSEPL